MVWVADKIVSDAGAHGYTRPLKDSFYWGCNGGLLRTGLTLKSANLISTITAYINTVLDGLASV